MKTQAYHSLCKLICDPDNWVTADSFRYMDVIAEGGFGLVVRCKKKSTGVEFAMKIQPKNALLRFFRKDKRRVMTEMQAYSLCDHPYVTKLAYATQTSSLAMLVLPVAACGDLSRSLGFTSDGRFPVERVQFYAAEIVSALVYLHNLNIVYRDLKPGNILLNADGHVMLADFGSLADMGGILNVQFQENLRSSGQNNNCRDESNKTVKRLDDSYCTERSFGRNDSDKTIPGKGTPLSPTVQEEDVRNAQRTDSLVGTMEYMAPEILVMFGKKVAHKDGYTAAVDWWSMGILIYKLLVGYEPFNRVPYDRLEATMPALCATSTLSFSQIFAKVFGKVNYALPQLTPDSMDLINGLLTFDPEFRLGGGSLLDTVKPHLCPIRQHPFFIGIDWDAVETKSMRPPYMPTLEASKYSSEKDKSEAPVYEHLTEFLVAAEKSKWIDDDMWDTVYTPSMGVMTSSIKGARSPQVIGARGRTSSADFPTRNSQKYKVADEDQGFFYGWNYVNHGLVEEHSGIHPIASGRDVAMGSLSPRSTSAARPRTSSNGKVAVS